MYFSKIPRNWISIREDTQKSGRTTKICVFPYTYYIEVQSIFYI